jgi:RHS repeat-associated protein
MLIDLQHLGASIQLSGVYAPGSQTESPSTLGYDAAGDVTSDSQTGNQYLYDAEGRICAFETPGVGGEIMVGYLYDADGNRVAKGTITAMNCDPASNGFTLTESYVLGPSGEELTQLGANGVWQRTNVFAAGRQLATYDMAPTGGQPSSAPALHFQIVDGLGTRRMQTNDAGQPETDVQSLPYGDALATATDPLAPATADDATPLHFTGKERDTESGNDYFGARYYASSMGRWLSPDPTQLWYADQTNPQSMNLYGYGWNNPHRYIDKNGNEVVLAVAGAAIGFTTGFVGEWIHDDLSGKGFSWRDSLAYGAGGAATGALAGLTFGGSLLVQAAAGVATSTIGNVGGGLISRGIAGEDVWNADSITTDAKVGFFGGVIGEGVGGLWKAANVTKVKAPIPFGYAGQWAKRFGMGLPKQAADEAGVTSATLGALFSNVGSQINSGMESQYTPNWNYTPNWDEFDWLNLQNQSGCAQTGAYDSLGNSTGWSGCQ